MSVTKVLIVEDEIVIAMHIRKMLEARGFEVLDILSTGEEAIVKTEELRPDIILMDIILKGEIDGITATEKIKSRHKIPIIYMTAHSDENSLNRAKATEPHGYILKPINQIELYSAVEIALYKHEMERKLNESEQEFREMITKSPLPMVITDLNQDIVHFNDKFNELFGYTIEDISTADKWWKTCYPDKEYRLKVQKSWTDAIEKASAAKTDIEMQVWEVITKNRSKRLCEFHMIPLSNKSLIIMNDITEREKTEKARKESENRFNSLYNTMTEGVCMHEIIYDKSGKAIDYTILSVNQSYETILGIKKEQAIDKAASEIYKSDEPPFLGVYAEVAESGNSTRFEIYFPPMEKHFTISVSSPAKGKFNTIFTDITESKKAEEKIKASLHEKKILLQEIHHRVKNNMQIISSLLSLQSDHIRDEKDRELFKDSQNRVHSMAMVHEHLYQSRDLSRIEFSTYVRELASHLLASYKVNPANINIDISAKDMYIDINRAIPCGMIINELISNSLISPFPDSRKGEISIDFRKKNGNNILTVADNGVGFADDFDYQKTDSLGLQLVNAFQKQLIGEIKLIKSKGTKFEISFPEKTLPE